MIEIQKQISDVKRVYGQIKKAESLYYPAQHHDTRGSVFSGDSSAIASTYLATALSVAQDNVSRWHAVSMVGLL